MKRLITGSLVFLAVVLAVSAARAGLAYPDPPGGWVYTYIGGAAALGPANNFDSLDGTWDHSNGSSEWDGSIIDMVTAGITASDKPGGAMSITEPDRNYGTNRTYMRMQDPGTPSQYAGTNNGCNGCSLANPSNRKLEFAHNMTAEGCPDTVLDDGFTFTFRARIPTPAKTTVQPDLLYPNGEASLYNNTPQPYPAGGDGYLIADNAFGYFTIRQLAGGKIAFSLTVSNDTLGGLTTTPKANYQGLSMNALNGNVLNNNVNFNNVGASINPQYLPIDPTEWNEFWVVIQKDDSGLGTHIALVYTNGTLTPTVFHLTAAAHAGDYGTMSHFAFAMSQTAQMGAVDIDFMAYKFAAVFPPGAGGLPPLISSVSPTPPPAGNTFWAIANGISFAAGASGGKTLPSSGVLLVLNGVDVSSGLALTGGGTASVTGGYSNLVANTIYTGTIQVTDSGGSKSTFPLRFDTFTPVSSIVIEAEDYNYNSGQFVDGTDANNSYSAFSGAEGVDFHDVTPATLGTYRTSDAVDTLQSTDTVRQYVSDGGGSEFDVNGIEQGEWLNYTRTFATGGKYNVYLRAAAQVGQTVRLDLVTSDRTQLNQTTAFLGTFSVPVGGYTYAQVRDTFGNPLVLNLSGVQTLRLTAPTASLNLQLNYLVLVPTAAAANPPTIGYAAPAPNSTDMLPDAPILVAIVNRDTSVVIGTISNFLDGVYVTPSSTVAATPSGAQITYQPASQLALNSSHTNRLIFGDGTKSYTNQWTFTVANLPVLITPWATAPGSGSSAGFNGQIHEHNSGQDLIFINTVARAEAQVAGQLIDIDTGQPYVNQAAGPNGDGTFTETGTINYSDNGSDAGFIPGDIQFLYVVTPVSHLAMVATANLDLTAGLHRFGVRRNAGFKVASGYHFSQAGASLTLGIFETTANNYGVASTEFDFMVQTAGVYPFRLVFFEDSGSTSVEWYSVDRTTGARTLINAVGGSSVKAFTSRPLLALTPQKILNPRVNGANINFDYQTLFGYTYYVDYRDSVSPGSWTPDPTAGLAGDGSIHTFSVPANASAKRYYHIRAQ